ncbi:MAG: KH domain-containing protein [Candidatus Micrarchaeia archaeon]
MQNVLIPEERLKLLKKDSHIIKRIEEISSCRISFKDNNIEISGDPFWEFSAKNILFAFGRGFDINDALLLANDNEYFTYIDLGQYFSSDKRIHQVKARIIGKEGKVKGNIESISKAKISVYGDTVSFIGTEEEINEAQTCVIALIEGESHRSAYRKMEAAHRKNRELIRNISNM